MHHTIQNIAHEDWGSRSHPPCTCMRHRPMSRIVMTGHHAHGTKWVQYQGSTHHDFTVTSPPGFARKEHHEPLDMSSPQTHTKTLPPNLFCTTIARSRNREVLCKITLNRHFVHQATIQGKTSFAVFTCLRFNQNNLQFHLSSLN